MKGNWMTMIIPMGVVLILAIALFVTTVAERRKRLSIYEHAKAMQAAEVRSIWAGAEVISVNSMSGYDGTGKAGLSLKLRVTGTGGEPYTTAVEWLVDLAMLPQFQPGERLSVRVDPDDPQTVYPNMRGARYLDKG